MFSEIMAVVSWIGFALFLWSVSDSLAKIAAGFNQQKGTGAPPNGPGAA